MRRKLSLSKYYVIKNPAKKKYFITEDKFNESYKRHDGNYSKIARDFGMPYATTLTNTIRNSSWWSIEKYPAKGSTRKYLISEDEFKASYERHDGNYSKISRDFGMSQSTTLTDSIENLSWWSMEKYPAKGRRKYYISEEQFKESYERHGGNYTMIAKDFGIGLDSSLWVIVRRLSWWSLDKYPAKGSTRKYLISEDEFKASYERHDGNYSKIGRDFGVPSYTHLKGAIRDLPWWSIEKYPAKGSARKYLISEDEFKASYERHEGHYSKIARDFGIGPSSTLSNILRHLSWWSIEKYPAKGSIRKYLISEDEFKASYERHDGNYSKIARDFDLGRGATLTGSLEKISWWSKEKYPPKGNRKHYITEGLFKVIYRKHDGRYSLMAREIGIVGSKKLLKSVKNLPWWSIEKYPPNVMPVSGDKKRLNRGQYQNAITSYLAGEYGYKTSGNELKEETELLISDIRDAYKEGMSVDEISEAFSVEKAIVFRVLDLKKPNPQRLHMRRPVRIKSNPQNLINVNEIEDFIDRAIKDKRIVSPEVQNWLKTNFSDYLLKIIPSQLVSSIPHNAPEWMKEEFEKSSLKKGVISKALKDEFYYALDYIIKNKPKLGKVTDVLSKVK